MTDQLTVSPKQPKEYGFADRIMEPLARMRSEVDHLIEDFPSRLSAFQFDGVPAVEMTEADDGYTITVEVPGIPAGDIDLQVDRDMLIVKGEKKEESEEQKRDYVISERSYGAFERRMSIPTDALIDKIEAETADGVLRISIPRSEEAATQRRRIEVRTSNRAD